MLNYLSLIDIKYDYRKEAPPKFPPQLHFFAQAF